MGTMCVSPSFAGVLVLLQQGTTNGDWNWHSTPSGSEGRSSGMGQSVVLSPDSPGRICLAFPSF